jgi:membrane-bound lytic murein transglycosylase D
LLLLAACASQPAPQEPGAAATAPASPIFESAAAAPGAHRPTAEPLDAARLPPFEGQREELQAAARVARVDRTARHDDLWQRIRDGFAMPDLNGALVNDKVAWYVARPDYLKRTFERSRLYLHYIVEEIEKRGLPTELALLPMVESSFNPMAYSRAHASGLWQFIPGTGKRYELKQNWWYDGRRDIVASTGAALDYLSDVYDMHGDWHLALASYNWGEHAVARALEKNRAAGLALDYSSLTMPAETRHYVPKLQALKNIIANPAPFGIELEPIPNQPYFATITKTRDIDVRLAAKLAEMPVEEFVALNPGFSRPLIPVSVNPRIVLPADKVEVFHANLEKHDEKALVSWHTYTPQKGDTLESIARKHGIPVAQLKEVNGIAPRARGVPALLVVPANGSTGLGRLPSLYAPPIPVGRTRAVAHTVKAGETLPSIATRYRVSAEDLKRWNRDKVGRLVAGQKLTIHVPAVGGKTTRTAAKGKPVSKQVEGKPRPAATKKVVKKSG